MSTEENNEPIEEVIRNFSGLTKAAEEHAAPALYISRRYARGLLDYIAELEAKVEAAGVKDVDNVSNLKIGDEVETLIDYAYHNKGSNGVVQNIDQSEYPIRVKFVGHHHPVGYKRHELGKL